MDMIVTFAKDSTSLIEGFAIPFGGPLNGKDFHGEHFSAETDLCIPWFGETGRPMLYGHGRNPAMKTAVVGRQVALESRDAGKWVQAELDKSSRYHAQITQLVEQGALSFSSGAMPHLVETTKDGEITRWPWVELSLTPTPANPLTTAYAVKSVDMAEHFAAANIDIPDPLLAALKALDEWAALRDDPLAGSSYADESDRLLDALKAFAERTQGLADLRVKDGRALSSANRDRLAAHVDAIDAAVASMTSTEASMKAVLAATDPQAGQRLAAAVLAEWEYLSINLPSV